MSAIAAFNFVSPRSTPTNETIFWAKLVKHRCAADGAMGPADPGGPTPLLESVNDFRNCLFGKAC